CGSCVDRSCAAWQARDRVPARDLSPAAKQLSAIALRSWSDSGPFEFFSQHPDGAKDARLHPSDGDAEGGRDVFVLLLFDERERRGGLQLWRKLTKRALDLRQRVTGNCRIRGLCSGHIDDEGNLARPMP